MCNPLEQRAREQKSAMSKLQPPPKLWPIENSYLRVKAYFVLKLLGCFYNLVFNLFEKNVDWDLGRKTAGTGFTGSQCSMLPVLVASSTAAAEAVVLALITAKLCTNSHVLKQLAKRLSFNGTDERLISNIP